MVCLSNLSPAVWYISTGICQIGSLPGATLTLSPLSTMQGTYISVFGLTCSRHLYRSIRVDVLVAYVVAVPRAAAIRSTDMQAKEAETNHVKQVPTSMFFAHNTALGPPYHVLIDTNFVNFSIKVRFFGLHLLFIAPPAYSPIDPVFSHQLAPLPSPPRAYFVLCVVSLVP